MNRELPLLDDLRWREERLADPVHLAPDVVLLTYRGNREFAGSDTVTHSLRSSIWRRREGTWRVVFQQGTPAGESAVNHGREP